MLDLVESAGVVVTDSGGLQEETTALGVPCLTVRENTERPITVTEGTNRLVRTRRSCSISRSLRVALQARHVPRGGTVTPLSELWRISVVRLSSGERTGAQQRRDLSWPARPMSALRPVSQPIIASPSEEQRRRLLLVSYHFPPDPAVGGLRWQQLTKYFVERGWTVDVIARDLTKVAARDEARARELPPEVHVVSAPESEPWLGRSEQAALAFIRRFARRSATMPSAAHEAAVAQYIAAGNHWSMRMLRW